MLDDKKEPGHLYLDRKIGQSICIGKDIVITICDVVKHSEDRAAKVRIGIEAPKSVPVVRSDAIVKEKK